MKRIWLALWMSALVCGAGGCVEVFDDGEDDDKLRIENASSYTVTVIPSTTQWGGVKVEPGERATVQNVRDLDYYWYPPTRVVKGAASSDRDVIFVNAPPAGLGPSTATPPTTSAPPTIIIVPTNATTSTGGT